MSYEQVANAVMAGVLTVGAIWISVELLLVWHRNRNSENMPDPSRAIT